MRGKGGVFAGRVRPKGITPACAGKSKRSGQLSRRQKDHPRACGEKPTCPGPASGRPGSPPRMRGKAQEILLCSPLSGITPAHAGKSTGTSTGASVSQDHPRVCGEKFEVCDLLFIGGGITPAYVGKSRFPSSKAPSRRDHPRVCGEKFHPASDRKLGRVQGTKRSSGPAPAAAPAGLAGSCPASPPWSYPPRITVSRPRP